MATYKAENSQQTEEPWTKQILCRYFVHGICKNGNSCRYSHELTTPPNLICRYYQNGHCSYGEQCRYDHVKVDKQAKKKAEKDAKTPADQESRPINSTSLDVDWVNAVEFVPGKEYAPRHVGTYSAAVREGLDQSTGTASSPPSKIDDICPYALNGECKNGESCAFLHGLMCDMCGLNILHPTDVAQQEKHKEECMQYHEDDMKESFKIAKSKEIACGICMEVVWEKSDASKRKFGILENCNHTFCLECIRKWRSAKAFKNKVVKACPQCRISSAFVTPSDTWVDDEDEKRKLIKGYKDHLSVKPCRYFDQGKGKCPFGANCFYKHAYADGSLQDRSKIKTKKVIGSRGATSIDAHTIWDFIEERDESSWMRGASIMDYLQDDLDLFDIVYLLGDDSNSSSEDDVEFITEFMAHHHFQNDDSSGPDYFN